MMKLLERLDFQNKTTNKDNIFAPPMDAQTAVNFIQEYLLGEDWYTVNPICTEQVNTEIVFDIVRKYSKRFRKEYKKYRRGAE